MSERLSADVVIALAGGYRANPGELPTLAREVQEWRKLDALRPICPTCKGGRRVCISVTGIYRPCPDCPDGRMPLDRYIALLIEDGERLVRAVRLVHPNLTDYRLREAVAAHDALPKPPEAQS